MKGILCFIVAAWASLTNIAAQMAPTVTDFPMPAGHRNGLIRPGFRIQPRLHLQSLGDEKRLILEMDVTMGTAQNPAGSFSYRYMRDGKEYTDQDLGFNPFHTIGFKMAEFLVHVQGPSLNTTFTYSTNLGRKDLGIVDKDTRTSAYAVYIRELSYVSYKGTEAIEAAIRQLEESRKKAATAQQTAQPKNEKKSTVSSTQQSFPDKTVEANKLATGSEKTKQAAQDDFWSEKKTTNTASNGIGQPIPHNPGHKNLPDFVRTTDGGYFHRGADGRFREVTAEEYNKAKAMANTSKQTQSAPEEQKMSSAEVKASVDKMFSDIEARNAAIDNKINALSQSLQQNFYHSEAIRTGKQNLANLSRLSGTYESVEQLEADFNYQYNAIRGQVDNIRDARNARLNNAAGTLNGNSTEVAIGQSMQKIGGMINHMKAEKEERKAQEALAAERQRQLAAIEAAQNQARINLRHKLLESFPGGGTPLTSHKVGLPQVYLFGYIVDKTSLTNRYATVSVSNVFPVAQYSDGTFPLKTIVANKLRGLGTGEIVLVGFYGDKNAAEKMRNAFLNMAARSELGVRAVTVKSTGPASGKASSAAGDFWENGTGTKPATDSTKKTDSFWNN